jgi:hypothetical protein
MSNDARDDAIVRLAAALDGAASGMGADDIRATIRQGHRVTGLPQALARYIFDALGLVAVPPDLVDAVRAADAAYSQRYPNSLPSEGARCVGNDDVTDVEVDCNETRLALADAILAQLTETKGTT